MRAIFPTDSGFCGTFFAIFHVRPNEPPLVRVYPGTNCWDAMAMEVNETVEGKMASEPSEPTTKLEPATKLEESLNHL